MSNLYIGPSIDASYKVSVHLARQFQGRRFLEINPTRKKNCLWLPYLLTDRDEMSNLYRELSIDASYQFSIHLAEGFQWRRLKYDVNGRQTTDAKWWQKLTLRLVRWPKKHRKIRGPSCSWSYGSWIYNYLYNQCLSPLMLWVRILLRRGVLDTTLCDKVCQWLVAGRWLSLVTLVSSINKTDRYSITEILLKV